MCKFNLIEAISSSIDPLTGWRDQKHQPAAQPYWEFPVLPPIYVDNMGGPSIEGADAPLPDDLQDLFMNCEPMVAPTLPCGEQANHMLDDLLTDAASSKGSIFDDVSSPSSPVFSTPSSPLSDPEFAGCPEVTELLPPTPTAAERPRQQLQLPQLSQLPPTQLPPAPKRQPPIHVEPPLMPPRMTMDYWAQSPPATTLAMSPTPSDEGSSIGTAAPCSPLEAVGPARRRQQRPPRPYDKPARRQITEEERKLRKKEQNKSAATRYRRKKKEEQEVTSIDLDVMESRNKALKEHCNTLTRELAYLKHLMKEVIKYKRSIAGQ